MNFPKSQIMLLFISLLSLLSCKSSTEPIVPDAYMSLNVGDIRELLFQNDSTYMIFKIIGQTNRSDKQEVFIGEWSFSGALDSNLMKSYYFIKDGYFISTELDTTDNGQLINVNPFFEQKLAKIYPNDGDEWVSVAGFPDSNSSHFRSIFIGEKQTPASVFNSVFGFQLDSIITPLYAKKYGFIGSSISTSQDTNHISVNYLKINGKELGEFVPFTNLPKRSFSKIKHKHPNPFGQIVL